MFQVFREEVNGYFVLGKVESQVRVVSVGLGISGSYNLAAIT